MAVVVAHLDSLVVAAPFRPVQHGRRNLIFIPGLEAKERSVVHPRWVDDLSGIQQPLRIEPGLDFTEARREPRTEERRNPLRANQTVAVLARIGALLLFDERAGLFGDRAHLACAV